MTIRRAAIEALKSTHKQHRMGAVIVKGGRVLSTGYNTMQPSARLGTNTRHAEAHAILKLLKEGRLHSLAGADLYVTRFTRGGSVGLSRPCSACAELARSVGVSRVFYSTGISTEVMELQ